MWISMAASIENRPLMNCMYESSTKVNYFNPVMVLGEWNQSVFLLNGKHNKNICFMLKTVLLCRKSPGIHFDLVLL